jgi:quercetin dioxygenase-like cupin family protein
MSAKVVGPRDGKAGFLGSIGVRFMIDGAEAGERFSLVEHPMSARALAAPLHRHTREDEYSYVLEGRMGALLGDEVLVGSPGDLVFKPRNQWHTFWNAGDEPARILEIISPAGFERFFAELVDLGGVGGAPPQILADLCARYGLEMDPQSVPGLVERFGCAFRVIPCRRIYRRRSRGLIALDGLRQEPSPRGLPTIPTGSAASSSTTPCVVLFLLPPVS